MTETVPARRESQAVQSHEVELYPLIAGPCLPCGELVGGFMRAARKIVMEL